VPAAAHKRQTPEDAVSVYGTFQTCCAVNLMSAFGFGADIRLKLLKKDGTELLRPTPLNVTMPDFVSYHSPGGRYNLLLFAHRSFLALILHSYSFVLTFLVCGTFVDLEREH
jgi:hypothetical protein